MPLFFKQTKLTSFQRQLNLYGFKRISTGSDNGGYHHPLFLQGQPHLAEQIKRQVQPKNRNGGPNNHSTPSDMRKVTPMTTHPSAFLPTNGYGRGTGASQGHPPPPHSYYPYAPSLHPSYYGMPPPNGSYHTPYPYPYMYATGWPTGMSSLCVCVLCIRIHHDYTPLCLLLTKPLFVVSYFSTLSIINSLRGTPACGVYTLCGSFGIFFVQRRFTTTIAYHATSISGHVQ